MKGLTKEVLRRISWYWHGLADAAQARLEEDGMTPHKIEIYPKLLMRMRWHQLIDMLITQLIAAALSPDVIKKTLACRRHKTFTYAPRLLP